MGDLNGTKTARVAQIACNLGAGGMGGRVSVADAFEQPRIAARPRLQATGTTRGAFGWGAANDDPQ